MIETIHGLHVASRGSGDVRDDLVAADVFWHQGQCLGITIGDAQTGSAVLVERDGAILVEQVFAGPDGAAICRFLTSNDGRYVESQSLASLDQGDLYGLFVEPVMRTILSRMGLVSFHAAALVKQGSAVLILGRKGAGKSSLAGAMYQIGWQPLADDLVRVIDCDGRWHAAAGGTASRVNADTARALGFNTGALATRWSIPGAVGNKFLLPSGTFGPLPSRIPIRAVLLLDARDPTLANPRCHRAAGGDVLRGLVANLTPDPLAPGALPSRDAMGVVGALSRQAAVYRLSLPDRFGALKAAATAVDACLACDGGSVAA